MDICAFKGPKMFKRYSFIVLICAKNQLTLLEKLYLLHKGMDGAFFKFGNFIFAKIEIPILKPPK